MPEERLQKILSRAGITSRRKAEELIVAGLVTVNGKVITELGTKADIERDHIKVSGKLLREPRHAVYVMLYKPKGCVTTVSDPEERETVMKHLRGIKDRVYPIGRLDYDTEGLLLFTNDGDFANRVTRAENHVAKTYAVKTTGLLTAEQEAEFKGGVPLHGRKTAPARIRRLSTGTNPWYEVQLIEGRKNQIKLMFRHFGLLVEKLKRTRIGFLDLKGLKPGEYRHLEPREVERFKGLLKME